MLTVFMISDLIGGMWMLHSPCAAITDIAGCLNTLKGGNFIYRTRHVWTKCVHRSETVVKQKEIEWGLVKQELFIST